MFLTAYIFTADRHTNLKPQGTDDWQPTRMKVRLWLVAIRNTMIIAYFKNILSYVCIGLYFTGFAQQPDSSLKSFFSVRVCSSSHNISPGVKSLTAGYPSLPSANSVFLCFVCLFCRCLCSWRVVDLLHLGLYDLYTLRESLHYAPLHLRLLHSTYCHHLLLFLYFSFHSQH